MRTLLLSALLFSAAHTSYAGPVANPLISIWETGAGSLLFPAGVPIPMPGVLAPDPGPGGLASALTFDMLGPPALVAGDLILSDGSVSDIIRFNPAGTGGGAYPASIVFYSVSGGGMLADVGLPGANYATTFSGIENEGTPFLYTPGPSDPGYVEGFAVTYSISGTPEPATFGLMLAGAGALWAIRRRRSA